MDIVKEPLQIGKIKEMKVEELLKLYNEIQSFLLFLDDSILQVEVEDE